VLRALHSRSCRGITLPFSASHEPSGMSPPPTLNLPRLLQLRVKRHRHASVLRAAQRTRTQRDNLHTCSRTAAEPATSQALRRLTQRQALRTSLRAIKLPRYTTSAPPSATTLLSIFLFLRLLLRRGPSGEDTRRLLRLGHPPRLSISLRAPPPRSAIHTAHPYLHLPTCPSAPPRCPVGGTGRLRT
jgi:hypothetical protein